MAVVFLLFSMFGGHFASAQSTTVTPTVLRLGIAHFYPPFVYNYSSGFDIAFANAICKQTGYNCIFYSKSLAELMKSLQNGEIDAIMSALSITPQRQKVFDFTKPYLISTVSFLGLSGTQYPSDLTNLRIGVIASSTFDTYLKAANSIQAKIVPYSDYGDLIAALGNGNIDLILLDTPVGNYWVDQSNGRLKLIGQPFVIPFDGGLGIAVRKGDTALAYQLDQALVSLVANGTYSQLVQMYFNLGTDNFNNAATNSLGVVPPKWVQAYLPRSNFASQPAQ